VGWPRWLPLFILAASCGVGSPNPSPSPAIPGLEECQAFAKLAFDYLHAVEDAVELVIETRRDPSIPPLRPVTQASERCKPFKDQPHRQVRACLEAGAKALRATETLLRALEVATSLLPVYEKEGYLSLAGEVWATYAGEAEVAMARCST
jgi:hypothetical protein